MQNPTRSQTRDIAQSHCQACGSTDPRDIRDLRDTEGYTRCCNQRVVSTDRDIFGRTLRCSERTDCYHD